MHINISPMTRWITARRFCLQRNGTIMSLCGTVTWVLMLCVGSSGQSQLMGVDWVRCWANPWIHLRQKETHQPEHMNEQNRMSQQLCGKCCNGQNNPKEILGKETYVSFPNMLSFSYVNFFFKHFMYFTLVLFDCSYQKITIYKIELICLYVVILKKGTSGNDLRAVP